MYEANWKSIDSRPVPQWFHEAKFGIFIHWGVYSVPAYSGKGQYAEWYGMQIRQPQQPAYAYHQKTYGPNMKYEDFVDGFKAELFDAKEWARLFQRSGAKYIHFVSKHHDGFCMFPSSYAWNWNSVDVGPHRDFLMELKEAMEGTGVKFGVYHSVYEWFNPLYLRNPEEYAVDHLIPMLKEMIEKYQPWSLYTDGEWDQTSDTWHSTEFLSWLFNESSVKDTIVVNDRWGKETRGHLGGYFTTEYGTIDGTRKIEDVELDRPFEECRGIGMSFGFNRIETTEDYLSPKELIEMLCSLVSKGGNLVINIGPAADGTIPVIMEERLLQMGQWLSVNGEAIYGTETYTKEAQDGVYYTKKGDKVYAILNRFPFGSALLEKVAYKPGVKARLLSSDAEITVREKDGKCELVFPPINPDEVSCQYLYAVELTNAN